MRLTCRLGLHVYQYFRWIEYGYNPFFKYGKRCKHCPKQKVLDPWHDQKYRLNRISKSVNNRWEFENMK